ncbi:MAG: hypothetical protein KAT26_10050, partial [Marinosulfonomonas sp.]|nr:hypothetical protein [Marinosulfonomonas sp.]
DPLLKSAESAAARNIGRPSLHPYVVAAFEGLSQAGLINTEQSAKSHFAAVRNWIAANSPNCHLEPEDIGDEGIRGHFSPLFNALKKNSKQ